MIATAPKSSRVETVRCCVCGTGKTEDAPVAVGFDFEYESTHDSFQFVRCANCGLVYLNPRPSADELSTIYPPDYYAYHYQDEVHALARAAKNFLDARKMDGWLGHLQSGNLRFLDVGCGDGRYLRALHRRGVPKDRLWGVELNRDVVESLFRQGFQAYHGRIESITELPAAGFDLIVMLQVLEHVADPGACVDRLSSLLDRDGLLVLETPNVRSLDRNLFRKRYWGGYHFPRHWNLFDEVTMKALLDHHGLETIGVRFLPAPSFWIYSLRHVAKYAWGMPRLAKMLNPFRNLPLQVVFTSFDMVRAAVGLRTSNMQVMARRRR